MTEAAMPSYVPVLILFVVALGFGLFTVLASWALGRPRSSDSKVSTYECGMPPIGTARERFPIKFFLVCMIFILLDVDAAFLYPWALVFRDLLKEGLGRFVFLEMSFFVALLAGGFAYAWKTGALDW